MERRATVLGGDMRQVHLARLLQADGWTVRTWGLEKGGGIAPVPLHQALEPTLVILPLPVSRDGTLYLPLTDTALQADTLWPRLRGDQLLLGGMTGSLGQRLWLEHGLTLLDYYQREEVQLLNAVPTAEGAIQRAMEATDTTVQGAACLITGYGRVGQALARRLQALGAAVTVAARSHGDLARARADGLQALPYSELAGHMAAFAVIFNTVPAQVLDASLLAETPPECALLELASPPGGIHREAAEKLKRRVIDAPGLPGRTAPRTAAEIIQRSIYHILEERGEAF